MPSNDIIAILNTISDPVLLVDSGQRITLLNQAAEDQLGAGLAGQYFARALREPEALACLERVLGGVPRSEAIIHRHLPVRQSIRMRAALMSDLRRVDARVAVTLSDVSHVYEAEQMRSDFVANVSHELRSPLTSLTSIIETLKEGARDDPKARERFLAVMEREAARMNRLIDDLLSLSSVEVNAHIRPTEPVDMSKVIRQVVNTIESRGEEGKNLIQLQIPSEPAVVAGDEDELTQVFHNLIENAQKYAGTASPITIAERWLPNAPGFAGPVLSIAVRDQGPGIAPEHLPRLTERFYRVDEGRSRDQGGTGLGLAIVKHIVNRHRGRLHIESEIGIGTTFTVQLPQQ